MAQTKVTGGLLSTTSNYEVGVITATKFVGPFGGTSDRGAGYFSSLDVTGDVNIGGTLSYVDVDNITATGIITAQDSVQIGAGLSVAGVSTFTSSVGIADSIIHLGNTDTSIRFPADDTFAVDIAGTEKFFINANGSVGIGTHEIDEPLDVYGNFVIGARDTTDAQISVGRTDAGNRNAYIDLIGDNTYSDYGLRLIRQNGGTNATSQLVHRGTGTFEIAALEAAPISIKNGGHERLYIKTTGEVGIGSESPNAKFVVSNEGQNGFEFNPNFNSNNSIIASYNRHAAVDAYTQLTLSASQHIFSQGGTEYGRFNANGRLGIGTEGPETILTIAQNATNQTVATIPTVRLTNLDTTAVATDIVGSYEFFSKDAHSLNKVTGFMRNIPTDAGVNYDLTFGTIKTSDANAVERLRIKSDGKVGIGTITPGEALDVNGSIRLRAGGNWTTYATRLTSRLDSTHMLSLEAYHNSSTPVEVLGTYADGGGANVRTVIAANGMKVGIGTDVPDYGLHVYGAGDILVEDHGNGSAHLRLRSCNNGSDVSNWKIKTGSDNHLYIENDTVGGASQVTIDPDANLSIRGDYAAAQDYPTIRPRLDFNFKSVNKLDSRLTYHRSGSASYTDKNGIVKLVGANVPRFDHDPMTGECKGLLIETSSTNYIRQGLTLASEWASGSGNRGVDNTITNPDGSVGAWYHTGGELYHQNIDLSGASTSVITISMWVKEKAGQSGTVDIQIYQQISGSVVDLGACNFNPTTGVLGTADANFSNGTVTQYPNGWYRFSATVTTGSGNFSSSTRFDMQNKEHYVWGMQVETGSKLSSFIPTKGTVAGTAPESRGYEYLSMEGSDASDLFNELEGTLVAEWIATESEANQNLVSFHKDLGSNERIELRATATNTAKVRFEVVIGGSSTVSDSSISHGGIGDNTKAAFGFKKDDYAYSVNGSAVATDSSGNMPSDINSLMIGRAAWGSSWFDGYVKRILYYPKRLPNSQLITITS